MWGKSKEKKGWGPNPFNTDRVDRKRWSLAIAFHRNKQEILSNIESDLVWETLQPFKEALERLSIEAILAQGQPGQIERDISTAVDKKGLLYRYNFIVRLPQLFAHAQLEYQVQLDTCDPTKVQLHMFHTTRHTRSAFLTRSVMPIGWDIDRIHQALSERTINLLSEMTK